MKRQRLICVRSFQRNITSGKLTRTYYYTYSWRYLVLLFTKLVKIIRLKLALNMVISSIYFCPKLSLNLGLKSHFPHIKTEYLDDFLSIDTKTSRYLRRFCWNRQGNTRATFLQKVQLCLFLHIFSRAFAFFVSNMGVWFLNVLMKSHENPQCIDTYWKGII
jgi:hypothetical protein